MIRLAVPNGSIYSELYNFSEEFQKSKDIQIIKLDEMMCFDYLVGHRADAALLNPLTYGLGISKADFRIINAPMVLSENRTNLASIIFNQGMKSIGECKSSTPDDYLVQIGKILLSEKFDINVSIEKFKGTIDEILAGGSTAISWNQEKEYISSLDISEEWFDQYEVPLTLAFWVCHAQEFPVNIESILNNIKPLPKEKIAEINTELIAIDESFIGKMIYEMPDDFGEILEHILHLLFYHQYFDDIPEVKIFGKEAEEI